LYKYTYYIHYIFSYAHYCSILYKIVFIFLYGNRDVKTIGKHINNVYKDGELEKLSTVANFAIVQNYNKLSELWTVSKMEIIQKDENREVKRNIEHYNLDMIISVGYKVNSTKATKFKYGTAHYIITNNGVKYPNNRHYNKSQKRVQKLHIKVTNMSPR